MQRLLPLLSRLTQLQAGAPGLQHASSLLLQHATGCSNSMCSPDTQLTMQCEDRAASGAACSSSGWPAWAGAPIFQAAGYMAQPNQRSYATMTQLQAPEYALGLHNLRDNPGALKKRIRVGRGDSARKGNYAGRGLKGQKARSRAHILYDGGQMGMLKFPVVRERAPYEVLYNQLGVGRLVEWIQLGRLDHTRLITMKDLVDTGCITDDIKYGVLLYGKADGAVSFPIHIQVTACEPGVKQAIEARGGSVTRVYYAADGLRALLHPDKFLRKGLPLPQPPPGWHPKHDGKFDAVGQLPPVQKPLALACL